MKTDIEIASSVNLKPINEIAKKLGLSEEYVEPYGRHMAKIALSARERREAKAPLVLVTAMTPTPAGEGKTTVSIGLSDALNRIGKRSVVTLREPSLGPVFGVKGGAAGGGYSQVLPMTEINLHFTGDIHAVGSAHNLLAALVDNRYARTTVNRLLPKEIIWHRVIDMNDRALRNIVIGLGDGAGQIRQSKFEITASSEVMAILGLSYDLNDLKERLGDIVVAELSGKELLRAKDINAHSAMTILLKDALKPNLVQSIEGNPAIIHTGPFANIAHGTNSIIATDMARRYADIVVIEAGFGSDLGAEKFFNLVSRQKGMVPPSAVVIVATVRALKYHGGVSKNNLTEENLEAIEKGFANLQKHIENMKNFGRPVFVAVNRFPSDTETELELVRKLVEKEGTEAHVVEVWAKGGEGALSLAESVWKAATEAHGEVHYTYDLSDPLPEKIKKIATSIYGARDVHIPRKILKKIEKRESWGINEMPVCMAKTQSSLSDNPKLLGRPRDFSLEIRDIKINSGAKFVVVYAGDIMTMPGLPKIPAAEMMDIDENGNITGLF